MILRFSILLFISSAGFSQSGRFVLNEIDQNVLNDDLLRTKYGAIAGSPYLFDNFSSGSVRFVNNQTVESDNLRLDLVSHGIQIKREDKILEYNTALVEYLSISDEQAGTVLIFSSFELEGTPTLMRVIYDGPIQFLSYLDVEKRLSESTQTGYSSEAQQDRFVRSEDYYLFKEGSYSKIKLSKKSVLNELETGPALNEFIKTNKIKFKDESDVVSLLDFYCKNIETL